LTVVVHSAGVQDRVGARAVLMRLFCRFDSIVKVFVDGGYTGTLIEWARKMFGYEVEVVNQPATPVSRAAQTLDCGTNFILAELVAPTQQRLRAAPHLRRNHRLNCIRSLIAETLCLVFKQILR
jgi:hypothetical protein